MYFIHLCVFLQGCAHCVSLWWTSQSRPTNSGWRFIIVPQRLSKTGHSRWRKAMNWLKRWGIQIAFPVGTDEVVSIERSQNLSAPFFFLFFQGRETARESNISSFLIYYFIMRRYNVVLQKQEVPKCVNMVSYHDFWMHCGTVYHELPCTILLISLGQ